MKDFQGVSSMLAIALALSATSVVAEPGWAPQGDKGWPCYGESFCDPGAPMDPADAEALLSITGEPEAEVGFGDWAESDAGAQQPGKGAPWSGPRPR